MTVGVTPALEPEPWSNRNVSPRGLAHQIGDLDAEGSGQQVSGTHEARTIGLDPPYGRTPHSNELGELLLRQPALDPPVVERRQRN